MNVLEPAPSPELRKLAEEHSVNLEPTQLPAGAAASVIAVKPQSIQEALPRLRPLAKEGGLFVSIAAGVTMERIEGILGGGCVVRAMPNTPAAINRGITALAASANTTDDQRSLADALLRSVGKTVWLGSEDDMDAVTAVSGSGPAYVFFLIEALAEAGEKEGLAPDLAHALALSTVAGASALAEGSSKSPAQLRDEVTSPGGTTAEGLKELMHAQSGLVPLIRRTVVAAARRSRELGKDA